MSTLEGAIPPAGDLTGALPNLVSLAKTCALDTLSYVTLE